MNKYQEALDQLYLDATNGASEFIKQKHIDSINENRDALQELVDREKRTSLLDITMQEIKKYYY